MIDRLKILHRPISGLVALLALALAACSGEVPEDDDDSPSPTEPPEASPTPVADLDHDTWPAWIDCDDQDPLVYPYALETCDTKDNDCDGDTDEEVGSLWYPDADRDGYGASSAVRACQAPAGSVASSGDCDDEDPSAYPTALEVCDSRDNDCDGQIDEGQRWYPDADGDGFGIPTGAVTECGALGGYSASSGDCDDGEPSIHPGAPDTAGDGVDRDCGGTDPAQPSVGLEASAFTSIQAAIDAAQEGETVWVGPGTYVTIGLTLRGKAVTLSSSHGAEATVLDGRGIEGVVTLNSHEGAGTVLRGFTITGGNTTYGSGIFVKGASPTLVDLILRDNGGGAVDDGSTARGASADGGTARGAVDDGSTARGALPARTPQHETNVPTYGGGLYLLQASPTITRCVFRHNDAFEGGALYMNGSSPTLTDTRFEANVADGYRYSPDYFVSSAGGAVHLVSSSPVFTRCTFRDNAVLGRGGALYLVDSSPTLSQCRIEGNQAKEHTDNTGGLEAGAGGGLYLLRSFPSISHCVVAGNTVTGSGAGMVLISSSPRIAHTLFLENVAVGLGTPETPEYLGSMGGGLRLQEGSSPVLSHCALLGNTADLGGGLSLEQADTAPTVEGSILAWNEGYNLYRVAGEDGVPSPEVRYSDLFAPEGWPDHNLEMVEESVLEVEPAFVRYTPGAGDVDLHLEPGSPIIDAGPAGETDVGGSPADIGIYGGPGGAEWDLDGDGLPAWFWPGGYEEAPEGVVPGGYDCDDQDPSAVCSQNAALTWSVEERILLKPERPRTTR